MAMRVDGSGVSKPTPAASPFAPNPSSYSTKLGILQNGVSSPAAKKDAMGKLLTTAPLSGQYSQQPATPNPAPGNLPNELLDLGALSGGGGGGYAGSLANYGASDYLGNDSAYAAEKASIESEYTALLDQLTRQNADYNVNHGNALRSLGWNYTGSDFGAGSWDPNDMLGAYGQAFQNLQNDYSGRGLLDSSFYGNAQNDMTNRFERQRGDMTTALSQYQAENTASRNAAEKSKNTALDRALAESYARVMAGLV